MTERLIDGLIDWLIVSGGTSSDSALETRTQLRWAMSSHFVSVSDRAWSADDAGRDIELGLTITWHCRNLLLKSTFNAENVGCRLSFSDFDAIHSWNVCCSLSEKNSLKPPIWGFKSVDVGTTGKLVSSAFMISGNSVSICNRSLARRVNSGKITIS